MLCDDTDLLGGSHMWCDDMDSLQGEVACGVMTWIFWVCRQRLSVPLMKIHRHSQSLPPMGSPSNSEVR